jgi:hypothetical protein
VAWRSLGFLRVVSAVTGLSDACRSLRNHPDLPSAGSALAPQKATYMLRLVGFLTVATVGGLLFAMSGTSGGCGRSYGTGEADWAWCRSRLGRERKALNVSCRASSCWGFLQQLLEPCDLREIS